MAENKVSFEQAMSRLEEIVHLLDRGSEGLDKSLELFEEGISLVKLCNTTLAGAEQKVKLLVSGENGEMTETDFSGGAN